MHCSLSPSPSLSSSIPPSLSPSLPPTFPPSLSLSPSFSPSTLQKVVKAMATTSIHVHTKQLRNDLLTLCSLTADLCPDAPFVVSTLFFCVFVASVLFRQARENHLLISPHRRLAFCKTCAPTSVPLKVNVHVCK